VKDDRIEYGRLDALLGQDRADVGAVLGGATLG
jgi:hypothetical protein